MATAKKTKRKANPAFMKPLTPSPALSEVVGSAKLPRTQVVKKLWAYIKRKGLQALLERTVRGDKFDLVVAHRDRLCRFGFDLIEFLILKNGGKLVVLDQSACSPEEELTKDLLNILHIFSCRMHGLRNYKKQVAQATSNNSE